MCIRDSYVVRCHPVLGLVLGNEYGRAIGVSHGQKSSSWFVLRLPSIDCRVGTPGIQVLLCTIAYKILCNMHNILYAIVHSNTCMPGVPTLQSIEGRRRTNQEEDF